MSYDISSLLNENTVARNANIKKYIQYTTILYSSPDVRQPEASHCLMMYPNFITSLCSN